MFKTIVTLAVFASAAVATCPTLTTPQLCGSDDVVIDLEECANTTIPPVSMPGCCRLQSEQARKCDDPNALQACRSIEISSGLCPGNAEENCCFRKELNMKLYFEFEVTNKTCCSKCRCYGDPHCESFDGTPDTWVLCDARTPKTNRPDLCPMTKAMCLAQTDQNNRPCNWTQTNPNMKWDIGMMGSPCVPSDGPAGFMTMYEAENFKLTLFMGERSVIKNVLIEDMTNSYSLSADDCFAAAYSNTTTNPWRTSPSTGLPPPSMPADWLPYKWAWGPVDGEDVLWDVTDLTSLVDMTVRCTRTVQISNGRRRYGPPRLNVDIVEPLDYKDADQRPNAGGFCPAGVITKQGSHQHTDQILQNNWCTNTVNNLDVAQVFCGAGTTAAGVQGCIISWCRRPLSTSPVRTTDQVTQCVNDVNSIGWDRTFCATMLLPEPVLASACINDGSCRQCVNDITDFGWAAAVAKYTQNGGASSDCVTRADLPPDLAGSCTKGVKVQYYDSASQQWITQFAIPAGTCLVDGYITVTSFTDAPLFVNPVRLLQCSEPKGTCLNNKCAAEIGFTARMELDVQTSEFETVWNLFESGILICNPAIYPNPQDCLGFTPQQMCPCPAGRRLQGSVKRETRYLPK